MSERQAKHSREWLDSPGSEPVGVDPDVIEAILALRPELARTPNVDLDELVASIATGPLVNSEPKQLAEWLERGGEAPPSLDGAVKEAVVALKPDLAAPPTITPEELSPALQDEGGELPSSLASHRDEPKPANRWNFALMGTLLAAALVLFIVLPQRSGVENTEAKVALALAPPAENDSEGASPTKDDLAPQALQEKSTTHSAGASASLETSENNTSKQKKSRLAKEKSREGKVQKKMSEPVINPAPAPGVHDSSGVGRGTSGFGSGGGGIARRKSESTAFGSGSAGAVSAEPSRDLDDAVRPRAMVIPEVRTSPPPPTSLDEEEAEESLDAASDGAEIGVVGGINPVIAAAESAAVAGRYAEAGEMLLAHIQAPAETGAPLGLKAANYFRKAKDNASALKAAQSALALGESSVSDQLRRLVTELESANSEAG